MAGLFDPKKGRYSGAVGTLLGGYTPEQKRKAFFSFHYDDIMRVNNVRNAWKIDHPHSETMRSFYDSSLWEARQLENPESIKNLIRDGVQYTSAVCVLIGTHTWQRRWVRYEVARSVIDGRGLLAVHLNGINHHQRGVPDQLGYNPLHMLGVGKAQSGKFYLYEQQQVATFGLTTWQWQQYQDYTLAVPLPRYLPEPAIGQVFALSSGTMEHNFALHDGHKNIGRWIDQAAQRAGR